MPFQPKKTRHKVESAYKSIYLRQTVIDEMVELHNIGVTMVEQCLEEIRKEEESQQ